MPFKWEVVFEVCAGSADVYQGKRVHHSIVDVGAQYLCWCVMGWHGGVRGCGWDAAWNRERPRGGWQEVAPWRGPQVHLSKKQGAASLLLVQLLLLLLHLAMSYTGDLAREPPRPTCPYWKNLQQVRISRESFARWSGEYDMLSKTKTKRKLSKSLSDQQVSQLSGLVWSLASSKHTTKLFLM